MCLENPKEIRIEKCKYKMTINSSLTPGQKIALDRLKCR